MREERELEMVEGKEEKEDCGTGGNEKRWAQREMMRTEKKGERRKKRTGEKQNNIRRIKRRRKIERKKLRTNKGSIRLNFRSTHAY